MRIENAKSGMILSQDLTDERGNLLLEKGIALTSSYIDRLQNLGIRDIYVDDSKASDLKQSQAISPTVRHELINCLQKLFTIKSEDILKPELRTIYFRQISSVTSVAISEITSQMPQIMNVQVRIPSKDDIAHAINVCLLSIIAGLYLKLPRTAIHDLAIGALLHDIGKAILPEVENADANPHLHALYGYNLLLSSEQKDTVARIAAEHHEACDGSGGPFGLSKEKIHPLSRIVAIANDFDRAASQATSGGFPLHEVVENMMTVSHSIYDSYVLRSFFHSVAVYPVGSLVRLNTGDVGHVVKNRPQFPLRPVVRITTKSGHTDINLAHRLNMTIVELIEE